MRAPLLLLMLGACSRQVHPEDDPRISPMERAVAVGLVAISTGIATTASQCPTTSADECRDLSWRAGSVVLGVTLATSAQAWLQAQDDEVQAAAKRKRSEAAKAAAEARAKKKVDTPTSKDTDTEGE
jgi:hypothetical protein